MNTVATVRFTIKVGITENELKTSNTLDEARNIAVDSAMKYVKGRLGPVITKEVEVTDIQVVL